MVAVVQARTAPLFLAPGERFAGAVDYLDTSAGLRGWVVDSEQPGRPVELVASCGSVEVARSVAVLDRPDIDQVLGRLTQSGFLIGWSRFDTRALARLAAADPQAPLEVEIAESGQALQCVITPPTAAEVLAAVKAAPVGDLVPEFHELNDYIEIARSGLFDAEFYQRTAPEVPPGMPLLLHYIRSGEAAGRQPSFYFDPLGYAREAGLAGCGGALLHFLRAGAATGVAPSLHFDGAWYEGRFGVPRGPRALAHYLASRPRNPPNRWFDPEFYRAQQGLPAEADAYEHFATLGVARGAFPSAGLAEAAARGALPPDAERYLARLAGKLREAAGKPPGRAGPRRRTASLAALPAAAEAPPPPPPRAAPAAAGWGATEARLKALDAAGLAAVIAAAEADMAGEPPASTDAALTLAIARGIAGDRPGAARAAAVFLADPALGRAALHEDVLPELARASHGWFERGAAEETVEVYRLLHQRGQRDYLIVVRLLEHSLRSGDAASAAPYAHELETLFAERLDAWGTAALSRYHQSRGDLRRAVGLLTALPVGPGGSLAAEALILHRLVECDDAAAAAARLAAAPRSDAPELFAARLRVAARRGDAAALALLLPQATAANTPDWLLAEAMFVLSTPGLVPLAEAQPLLAMLDAMIEQRVAGNPRLLHARMHFLLQTKRWEDLGLLFQRIEGTEIAAERETLLRRLEYYCHADNAQGAERIYREHFQDTPLNRWEGLTVLRLLSELKRWDEAARTLLAHVSRGFGFGPAQHLAMRVVRKASVHEAVLQAAGSCPPADRQPDLDPFLSLVREDLTILESARALTAATGRADYRSNWVLPAGRLGGEREERHCLFLCVNQKYFLSLLTFLCSFLGQAPQSPCKVFVFLDDDVPRHWYGTIAMVGARFGRSIELVAEPDFVPREVEHREDYGFFAGGGSLARAAYFRLYAARWLLARHSFARAVYIDTDTVCRGDLSPIFELDLHGKLLAAATEDYSLDVIDAATRHGLDPREYFNSGVLVLPMDDPGLGPAIEAAIQVAEREQERLMFQDQCALNIAFRGKVSPLPSRFNFFLRPHRERNGFLEDGLILHFVDKPKPWDIVFDRSYREEWRVWALLLGSILPQSIYVDIFAAANRD
jgi:lipopolysaccharide biosynthesis glycosyltransferase